MKLCQAEFVGHVLTCRACGVPFAGPFAISEADLAVIGGRLDRVYRPCGTPFAGARERAITLGAESSVTPMAGAPRTATATLADYRQCLHRGDVVRSEQCSTCRGNVLVKVFVCAVHGECQLSGRVPGVKVCGPDCREHAAPPG